MKSCVAAIVLALASVACGADSLVVSNLTAKLHEPWNGMVDVAFVWDCNDSNAVATVRLNAFDVVGGKQLNVKNVYNGDNVTTNNELIIHPGENCILWDAKTDLLNRNYSQMKIGMDVSYGAPYMAINLTNGTVECLQEEPPEGWGRDYKLHKLLLKKVYAGTDPLKRYSLSHDFYMGVFKVTEHQWYLTTGEDGGYDDNSTYRTYRTYTGSAETIVGKATAEWQVYSGYRSGWPGATAMFATIKQLTKVQEWGFPTEAQWEYACRIGNSVAASTGANDIGIYQILGCGWEYCADNTKNVLAGEDPTYYASAINYDTIRACGGKDKTATPLLRKEITSKHQTNYVLDYTYNFYWYQDSETSFRLANTITQLPISCETEAISVITQDVIIRPTEKDTFDTTCLAVELTAMDDDATIIYTIDGSNPTKETGRVYKGPFNIYQTTTVKAIVVNDGLEESGVVGVTYTKANGLGPALNLFETLPDNDAAHPWTVVTDVTHDGGSAVKSGAISDDESTMMKVVLYGAGQLTFWWKVSSEPAIDGEYYDFATFFNGSTEVTRLAGATGWQQVTLDVSGTGKHTFKWKYEKDGSGSTSPDGVWVDQVQWLPATTDYYSDSTLTTETPVKYSWLRQYGLGMETDFESAAKAKTGKRDGAGRELTVEDDYIAGTDPTNVLSHLEADIKMVDGVPLVKWSPDLNEEGTKSLRNYKIWGKESLDEESPWQYPTNALHRFFKVTVEMP